MFPVVLVDAEKLCMKCKFFLAPHTHTAHKQRGEKDASGVSYNMANAFSLVTWKNIKHTHKLEKKLFSATERINISEERRHMSPKLASP
jgi:hypothetical protein